LIILNLSLSEFEMLDLKTVNSVLRRTRIAVKSKSHRL